MARVILAESVQLQIIDAFTTLDEAGWLAAKVFTCVVVAVCRYPETGKSYIRPSISNDPTIFCYAVLSL